MSGRGKCKCTCSSDKNEDKKIVHLSIPIGHRPRHSRDERHIEGLRRAIPSPFVQEAAPTSAHPSLQLPLRNAQRDATLARAPPVAQGCSTTARVRSNT